MALPTVQEVKNYLRIQTNAQDGVIADLLAEAKTWAELLIGKTITASSKTIGTLWAQRDAFGNSVIYLPEYPVSTVGFVLTDVDDEIVPPDEYTVGADAGKIVSTGDNWFDNPPYEATADVGLSARSDYAGKERGINALIKGLTAILYHQSNPNASSDSEGGGVAVTYQTTGALPLHLNSIVESFRARRIA